MVRIENSKYYFPNITRINQRRLIRAFKQRFWQNSYLFKLVLELFKLQLGSLGESERYFRKKFRKWFVDTLLHQLGYILQRNPKDVLDLNSGSCDLTCHCFSLPAPLHFPGALDAVVSHAVIGLLQNLIEHPDEFGWILDRYANEAVEIAHNDHQASSALPSAALPSAASPSAAPPSAALPADDDCPMYD
jgi:hypothetical protein